MADAPGYAARARKDPFPDRAPALLADACIVDAVFGATATSAGIGTTRIYTAAHVDPLLAEIDADPTAIFWG